MSVSGFDETAGIVKRIGFRSIAWQRSAGGISRQL